MAQKKNQLLKVTLAIFAVISLLYGITYMFVPQLHVEASGSEPIPSGWIRWFGPILIGLGVGAFMVFRNPAKQGIFIKTLAIGTLLCGPTLVYTALFEIEGAGSVEQTFIPGIILIVISIMLWISLKQSKEILK